MLYKVIVNKEKKYLTKRKFEKFVFNKVKEELKKFNNIDIAFESFHLLEMENGLLTFQIEDGKYGLAIDVVGEESTNEETYGDTTFYVNDVF